MKIALVCTQGGHLTELMQLHKAFLGQDFFFITHHSSRDQDVKKITRSYFTKPIDANLFRFFRSFGVTLKILRTERPDVIISTGAEIAVPFFIIGKLFSIKCIYIESWCRIKTRSIAGRIIYPLADLFLVQWSEMLDVYGEKAKYWGAVI